MSLDIFEDSRIDWKQLISTLACGRDSNVTRHAVASKSTDYINAVLTTFKQLGIPLCYIYSTLLNNLTLVYLTPCNHTPNLIEPPFTTPGL